MNGQLDRSFWIPVAWSYFRYIIICPVTLNLISGSSRSRLRDNQALSQNCTHEANTAVRSSWSTTLLLPTSTTLMASLPTSRYDPYNSVCCHWRPRLRMEMGQALRAPNLFGWTSARMSGVAAHRFRSRRSLRCNSTPSRCWWLTAAQIVSRPKSARVL